MSNKELLNYFPIDPFSKKTHQVLGVGLLEEPNVYLPFLIVFEFHISYFSGSRVPFHVAC